MPEPRVRKIKAIKRHRLDVVVQPGPVEILRDDPELLSIAKSKRGVGDARSADEINILAGDGVKAKRLEDEPARHRS